MDRLLEPALLGLYFRTAHPYEPFPIQRRPKQFFESIRLRWIMLRWRLISPWTQHKSLLNGRILRWEA